MSYRYFLKIDGVKGGSKDPSHSGSIELEGIAITGRRTPQAGAGNASGGDARVSEILVLKKPDLISSLLFHAASNGRRFAEATLTVERTLLGIRVKTAVIKMRSVLVNSVSPVRGSTKSCWTSIRSIFNREVPRQSRKQADLFGTCVTVEARKITQKPFMNRTNNRRAVLSTLTAAFLIVAGLAASGNAQNATTKTQAVRVTNTTENPVPVRVIKDAPSKKRIQITVGTDIGPGGSGRSIPFPVPAGKRLVIEHVSAHTYRPPGLRMNITFDTYFDNDSVFDENQASATHGVVLVEQGTELNGYEVSTGSHNVLAFAEERLGTVHNLPLRVRFSLSGTVPFGGFARGAVVFTGYMEDHPAEQ